MMSFGLDARNAMEFSNLYSSSSQCKPLCNALETSVFEIFSLLSCMYNNDSINSLSWFALEKQSSKPKMYINSCLTYSILARFLRRFVQDSRPLINYILIYYFVNMNCCPTDEPEPVECNQFFEGKDCKKGIPSHFVLGFFVFVLIIWTKHFEFIFIWNSDGRFVSVIQEHLASTDLVM